MAAIGATNLTLLDLAKRRDPNDQIARIIEMLAQTNEVLEDMTFMEGNLISGHQTTVRTGLPDVYFRMYNQGTLTSKSHTGQIVEQTAMLDAWSQIDQKLAELGGDPAGARFSEARAFLEAMNQRATSTLWYGTAATPEEFIGLSPRYSDLAAGNADNIVSGGGTGSDNASIWRINWDEEAVTGIYPKGSTAGLQHEDKGIQTAENFAGVTGALLNVYRDHWMWDLGIALKDWRQVVRIANIDVSNLATSDAADLIFLMQDAEMRIQSPRMGRPAFVMNRTLARYLHHQSWTAVKAGGGMTYADVGGRRQAMFGTTPIRISDALVNTEEAVS